MAPLGAPLLPSAQAQPRRRQQRAACCSLVSSYHSWVAIGDNAKVACESVQVLLDYKLHSVEDPLGKDICDDGIKTPPMTPTFLSLTRFAAAFVHFAMYLEIITEDLLKMSRRDTYDCLKTRRLASVYIPIPRVDAGHCASLCLSYHATPDAIP